MVEIKKLTVDFIVNKMKTDYTIKSKVVDKKNTLILPVVMMVEGVHAGSHGALFHSIDELGKVVESWNGIPVVIQHPQKDGNYISANSPDIPYVGKVYNTHVDDGKLKAEIYIEETKIIAQSPTALAFIKQGQPLDVSVGVFTDEDGVAGEWNGETYLASATNHRPDHLALLPGESGACSWADGCGIRVNKLGINQNTKGIYMDKTVEQKVIDLIANGGGSTLNINEESLQQTMGKLHDAVYELETTNTSVYLEDAYPTFLIYQTHDRNKAGKDTYSKQSYLIDDEGIVELVGEPISVKKQVTIKYINLQTNKELIMDPKVEKTPCCLKKIDDLIAHASTSFSVSDKPWLLEQEETMLDKLFPAEPQVVEPPQVNTADAIAVLRETIKKPEDFIALLPDEMRDQMTAGLTLHKAQRVSLIARITANSATASFTPQELENMDTSMLQKMDASIAAPVDYSANGSGAAPVINEGVEVMLPAGVKAE